MSIALPAELKDARHTTKLVYLDLRQSDRELSQADIAHHCGIADRTVKGALRELHDKGHISVRRDPDDPRQKLYRTE